MAKNRLLPLLSVKIKFCLFFRALSVYAVVSDGDFHSLMLNYSNRSYVDRSGEEIVAIDPVCDAYWTRRDGGRLYGIRPNAFVLMSDKGTRKEQTDFIDMSTDFSMPNSISIWDQRHICRLIDIYRVCFVRRNRIVLNDLK